MTSFSIPSRLGASPSRRWLKRAGTLGFAFFFVKGLLWLIIPAVLWMFRG